MNRVYRGLAGLLSLAVVGFVFFAGCGDGPTPEAPTSDPKAPPDPQEKKLEELYKGKVQKKAE